MNHLRSSAHRHVAVLGVLLGIAAVALPVRAGTVCAPGSTPIPDGLSSASRTIEVPAPPSTAIVVGVTVSVAVTHPWVGDLRLALVHPSGALVVLLDRPGLPSTGFPGPWGCGGDDVSATFTDASAQEAESTCSTTEVPVIAGEVSPLEPLASFNGLAPGGKWTLVASDLAEIDAGTLGEVCLTVAFAPDCNGNGVPDADDIAAGTSSDANGDGVPDECDCLADIDGSGAVDGGDLAILLGEWGACAPCPADITGDAVVDAADLAVLLGAWGACG